jgi:tRNA threonylcarbamoyladenosine biosynthesis protein TsaB
MNTPTQENLQSVNILGFDTSGDDTSIALWTRQQMKSISIPLSRGSQSQAACLIPEMQALLKEADLVFSDLDVIATPTGPGSFTGIRLGLATAQGLALCTKAKSFSPTTLQVFAFGAWREQVNSYLVTLSTKRDSFYTQPFDESVMPIEEARILRENEIQDYLILHPESRRIQQLPTSVAQNLVLLYLHLQSINQCITSKSAQELPNTLSPFYLHNPEFVKQKPWSL